MTALTPPALFEMANTAALVGWIWLLVWLFLPNRPRERTRHVALGIPLVLSVLYAASILVHFGDSEGGFDTLANVMMLFTQPGMVLAGWVHYLAFDLFVGWCLAQHAVSHRFNRLLVVPCLFFTFMLGPIGLLLYTTVFCLYRFGILQPRAQP